MRWWQFRYVLLLIIPMFFMAPLHAVEASKTSSPEVKHKGIAHYGNMGAGGGSSGKSEKQKKGEAAKEEEERLAPYQEEADYSDGTGTYTTNADGSSTVTDADGNVTTYTTNADGTTTVTDANGNVVTTGSTGGINDYNNDGLINSQDDINGDGVLDEKDTKELITDSYSAINFKPVPGDLSVLFLGNIFGVVDGVLAGNGSQIAGEIFGVFNTAILALAGMMVFYTLLVSTLNTAADGQNIGKRWSSVLVPIRSVAGIAFLLPKASGYCVLQIFIMWVVIQGVGAADKVWNQALSYLNRGGTIVSANVDPITNMKKNNNTDVFNAAYGMFTGEVCMAALNKKLERYQSSISTTATCADAAAGSLTETFCKTAIPNFLDSVNFISDTVLNTPAGTLVQVPMPNFDASYATL